MHACGHDLHTASLIGGARLLAQHRDRLAGDVVLMFQPGEEGWDGAGVMIEEASSTLRDAGPTRRTGPTSSPPRGRRPVLSRPGSLMAASHGLFVTVRGLVVTARSAPQRRPDRGAGGDDHRAAGHDHPPVRRSTRWCSPSARVQAGTRATSSRTLRASRPPSDVPRASPIGSRVGIPSRCSRRGRAPTAWRSRSPERRVPADRQRPRGGRLRGLRRA